ncbi:MAG: vitamin B12 dependent-methionine synthase activation domain-containing protein [Lachnospiraceae bacterium]|nr:vitamin B12 dependent-methionine synthase activation domain-containing protein [Lachnospiraceae bacterium]
MPVGKRRKSVVNVNRREIYRYLGCGSKLPDAATQELVEDVLKELEARVTPRFIAREYALQLDGDEIDFTCFKTTSRSLAKNLRGCEKVLLFAATLGEAPDFLCRRYARTAVSREVAVQASAAAMIEAYCNELNAVWKQEYAEKGFYLRPRFSPGYGDFPLSLQPLFLETLRAGRTIGITLTDSLLMMPTKSVTAVIGIGREKTDCEPEGCEVCENSANCPYRRS